MGTLRARPRKAPAAPAPDAAVRITAVAWNQQGSVGAKPRAAPPPRARSLAGRLAHFAAETDRYWAFYLWVVMIAAGMWPPLLAPLFVAAFPSKLVAARAAGALAVWAVFALLPLRRPPAWGAALVRYILSRTTALLAGFDVVVAPGAEFEKGQPYVVGFEPHSTLPMGAVLAFNELAGHVPKGLHGVRLLASSLCFQVPFVRHVWWWLGFRPATRANMAALLARGTPVAVCPGGIREIALLDPAKETVYLRSRLGFVRQALAAGAPLVPAFGFGQTRMFKWAHPLPLPRAARDALARAIGFMPLWIHDGSYLPFPVRDARVTVVLGRPIDVPRVERPDDATVRHWLAVFVRAMEELYAEHAVEAGCGGVPLEVR